LGRGKVGEMERKGERERNGKEKEVKGKRMGGMEGQREGREEGRELCETVKLYEKPVKICRYPK